MVQTFFREHIFPLINEEDNLKLITYLRQHHILLYDVKCKTCSLSMKQVKKQSANDGYSFRCCNKNCNKYRSYQTIRSGSFLESFNISLSKFIYFLYLYGIETKQNKIIDQVAISESLLYKLIIKIRKMIF